MDNRGSTRRRRAPRNLGRYPHLTKNLFNLNPLFDGENSVYSLLAYHHFGILEVISPETELPAILSNRKFCLECFSKDNIRLIENITSYASRTSTNNMFNHLRDKHKINYERRHLSDLYANTKTRFYLYVALFVIRTDSAFEILRNDGLKSMLTKYFKLSENYIPSPEHLSAGIIPIIYNDCKNFIKTIINN